MIGDDAILEREPLQSDRGLNIGGREEGFCSAFNFSNVKIGGRVSIVKRLEKMELGIRDHARENFTDTILVWKKKVNL